MPPDFLVAGHVVQDLLSDSSPSPWRLGGAAAYASTLARNLGLRTAVLTACSPDLPLAQLLPGVEVRAVPGPCTTAMRNIYGPGLRRTQRAPRRAPNIGAQHLPPPWREAAVVLLGPVAGEIEDPLAACFPVALLGVGAQGWLREIGPDGGVRPVHPQAWRDEEVLRHAQALFLSDEDIPAEDAPQALARWSRMVETVCFTRGPRGADICHNGEWRHIGAFPARPVDPTGAGDVFAAAFLIRFSRRRDPWDAARFASAAASLVIEGEGTAGVPTPEQIEARLRAHPAVAARPSAAPRPIMGS